MSPSKVDVFFGTTDSAKINLPGHNTRRALAHSSILQCKKACTLDLCQEILLAPACARVRKKRIRSSCGHHRKSGALQLFKVLAGILEKY